MRAAKPLRLRPADRKRLEELVARLNGARAHVQRAMVVLLSAAGMRGTEIAERLHLTAPQVCRIRSRYDAEVLTAYPISRKLGEETTCPKNRFD